MSLWLLPPIFKNALRKVRKEDLSPGPGGDTPRTLTSELLASEELTYPLPLPQKMERPLGKVLPVSAFPYPFLPPLHSRYFSNPGQQNIAEGLKHVDTSFLGHNSC